MYVCVCVCLFFKGLLKKLPALPGLQSHSDKRCFSVNTHCGFPLTWPCAAKLCLCVSLCAEDG